MPDVKSVGQGIGQGLGALGQFIQGNIVQNKQDRLAWAKQSLEQQRVWNEKDFQDASIQSQKDERELKDKLANNATIEEQLMAAYKHWSGLTMMNEQAILSLQHDLAVQEQQGKINANTQANADKAMLQRDQLKDAGDTLRQSMAGGTAVKVAGIGAAAQVATSPTIKMLNQQYTSPEEVAQGAKTISGITTPQGGVGTAAVAPDSDDKLAVLKMIKSGQSDDSIILALRQSYPNLPNPAQFVQQVRQEYAIEGTTQSTPQMPSGRPLWLPRTTPVDTSMGGAAAAMNTLRAKIATRNGQ